MGFSLFGIPIPDPDPIAPFIRRLRPRQIPGTPSAVPPERRNPNLPGYLPRRSSGSIGSSVQQFPSIADILTKLQQLQDPSRYYGDLSSLVEQARASASAQYDPIIRQLRDQMGIAEQRATRNKAELGNMYGALSSSLREDIPEIQENFATGRQNTAQQYTDLQTNIEGQYKKSLEEQEELFRRLNIEAALPSTTEQQFTDRDYFTNLARTEGQTADTAMAQEGRGAEEFTRRGADIAEFEGTNRQADLMAGLEELLTMLQGQVGAQEAAKEQATWAGFNELQSSTAQQAQQQAQRDFENYLASISLGRQLRNDELGASQSGKINPATTLSSVPTRATELGLSTREAQSVQNLFMSTLLNDPLIMSGVDPGSQMTLTKEALAARVIEAGRNAGLSQRELNALQAIASEYFGRR